MTTPHEQLVAEEMAALPADMKYSSGENTAAQAPSQEKEFADRLAAERAFHESTKVNPFYGAATGAGLGLVGGEALDMIGRGRAATSKAEQEYATQLSARTDALRKLEDAATGRAEPKGMTAYGMGISDMTEDEAKRLVSQQQAQSEAAKLKDVEDKIQRLSPGARKTPTPGGSTLYVPPQVRAELEAQNATQAAEAQQRARAQVPPVKRPGAMGTFMSGATAVPAGSPISRTLGGAGAGYELVDAYNRAREGDFAGAAKSGLGAAGSALFTKKGVLPKVIGAGMLGAAEAMKRPEAVSPLLKHFNDAAAERKAAGGSVQHFDKGSVVKKAGQELIGRGVDTLMPALKNSGLFFPKVQPQPASKVLDPYRNEYFGSTISDRLITRLGRSKEKGGARFSTLSTVDPAYAGSVWGSGNANAASALANMQRDYPGIIIAPRVGTAEMHRSSTGVSDRVLRGFQKAVDQGLLPDDLRAAMNAKLAGHKKYVSQDGKPFFEPDIDVGAPDFADRLKTFEQRAAATETLGGEGVSRGRPDKGQIFDYDSIIRNTTEPGLLDVPVNSVGPRLFKLTGKYSHRPELNASYPYVHGGEDLGVEMMMTPHTALFPDKLTEMEAAIAAKVAAGTRKDPNVGSMDLSRNKLIQKMDPGFFHRLEDMGYNEGGEVGGLDALDRAYA